MKKVVTRDSNFEVMRIVSMFMIVVWHLSVHGISGSDYDNLTSTNQFFYNLIKSLTVIAVNIYVLISGYFLSKSSFKYQKVIKLIFEIFTFSMIMYVASLALGFESFAISSFVKSFFPIFFGSYWFASVYVVLFVLSRYINIIIDNLSKEAHLHLITLLFAIDCIWQYIYGGVNLGVNFGIGLFHFIFLYLVASFIRNYDYISKEFKNKYSYLIVYAAVAFLNAMVSSAVNIERLFSYNSPLVVLMAYCMFMFFKNVSIQSNPINATSKYIFGIYLIHDNRYVSNILWEKTNIIDTVLGGSISLFPVKVILYSLIVFLGCWLVSALIQITFNKVYDYIMSTE